MLLRYSNLIIINIRFKVFWFYSRLINNFFVNCEATMCVLQIQLKCQCKFSCTMIHVIFYCNLILFEYIYNNNLRYNWSQKDFFDFTNICKILLNPYLIIISSVMNIPALDIIGLLYPNKDSIIRPNISIETKIEIEISGCLNEI